MGRAWIGIRAGERAHWIVPQRHRNLWRSKGGRLLRVATPEEAESVVNKPVKLATLKIQQARQASDQGTSAEAEAEQVVVAHPSEVAASVETPVRTPRKKTRRKKRTP